MDGLTSGTWNNEIVAVMEGTTGDTAVASLFERYALELQRRVADEGLDLLLLTDPDSVYYVSGYWGFLGVDWGRPTVIAVPADGGLTLTTPKLESEMAAAMTWIEDISLLSRTGSAVEDPHGAFAGTNLRPEVAYDHRSIRNLSFGRQLEQNRDGPAVQRGTYHARGV